MSIRLEHLTKRYGLQTVVDDVSMEIDDGELLVLLGASGSGKSTILRMIAGLLPVDYGRIWLHGRDVTDLSPQQRGIGFVFQNYALFRHMSVAENIEFGLAVRGVSKEVRAAKRDELLELIGLAGLGRRNPRQLSGGQQQRVAVARALASEPSVLLLDEPFGALDVKIRVQLRQTLKRIQRHLNIATILVTHDQEEAFELGDRIGVIDHGQLLEAGPPARLYRAPQHEFVANFLGQATLLTGRLEDQHLAMGSLLLPIPPERERPEGSQVTVMLRPEDMVLAPTREALNVPPLGAGQVEQVQFSGTLEQVRIRLEPLPGIQPALANYGEEGVVVQVARLSEKDAVTTLAVGQSVWVGINGFHLLPQPAPHLLLCLDESCDATFMENLSTALKPLADGTITVLAVAEQREVAARLAELAKKTLLPRLGVKTIKQRHGQVIGEILREVGEGHYHVVLVHGNTPGGRDTVAEQVAQQAPIPVLIVKGTRPAFDRLLLCTAGGEPGKQDVLFAGPLARRIGAQVTLLHVANANTTPPPNIRSHLAQGVQTLHNQGVRAEMKMRQGQVANEILAEAAEGAYDMVVVGGHLSAPPPTLRDHDLATEIVRLSDRPVLVVRGALP